MDRFSPLRPACIRVLVLPIGKLERPAFLDVVAGLQSTCSSISLKELASQSGQTEFLFKPYEHSVGSLLFDFSTTGAPEQQSPFELWRDPLLVLGVVSSSKEQSKSRQNVAKDALEQLRERHGRVIHRHLLVLRNSDDTQHDFDLPNATYLVHDDPDSKLSDRLRSAVQNISCQFLRELATYAQAMQASPSIQTPGHPVQGQLRSMLMRDDERPRSNHSTPVEPRSPSGDDNSSRPTSKEFLPPPATSFDQIAAANTIGRSDSHGSHRSKSRARASSFDRVNVQALSKEKLKDRGKARVGVVIGSIYLLAGQWIEGLKILVDNTTRLRALSDHIWHGKGLETIFVCLLLHIWAGVEFQVPPICYQLSDKVRDRLSKAIAAELQQRVISQQTPTEKLAASVPDLLRHILLLYHAVESTLELPYIVVAEATVRLCKALSILHNADGVLDRQHIDTMLPNKQHESILPSTSQQPSTSVQSAKLSKTTIAELLAHAIPMHEENIKTQDQISILTGVASVYGLLGMQRKKVVTLRSLVNYLVPSIEQARRLGAAEMGIHPAASLSMENASDATSNSLHGSNRLLDLAQDIVAVFGLQLSIDPMSTGAGARRCVPEFGSQVLKLDILRDLLRLCESTSDLQGISTLVSACMTSIMSPGLVDASAARQDKVFFAEEQAKFIGMMSKAQNLSHQLGLPETLAEYWDPYLVRDISFTPESTERALTRLSTTVSITANTKQSDSNPLLYDPNAPKARDEQHPSTVAYGDHIICQVTLQNNLDTAIEIEQLSLVAEGVALATKLNSFVLGRSRMQQISFEVTPEAIGKTRVTGCRIKVVGCVERDFHIARVADGPSPPPVMKTIGQDVLQDSTGISKATPSEKLDGAALEVVSQQPYLTVQGDARPSSDLMLLDGEVRQLSMTLQNTTSVSAIIRRIDCSGGLRDCSAAANHRLIAPLQTASFDFRLTAIDVTNVVTTSFLYSAERSSEYVRTCSVRLNATVQPGLQVVRLAAMPAEDDSVRFSLDVVNKWHMPMTIHAHGSRSNEHKEHVAAGQIHRLHTTVKRWIKDAKAQSDQKAITTELLDRLRFQWSTAERNGHVPLSQALITSDVLDLVQGPPLSIILHTGDQQDDKSSPVVRAGSFFTLQTLVENRSAGESGPLRVQVLCHTEGITARETRRGITVVGLTHRLLPSIRSANSQTAEFALCALSSGVLEISATVKSVLPAAKDMAEGHTEHRLIVKVAD